MHYDTATNQNPLVNTTLRTIKNISYHCPQCERKTAADISIVLDVEQDLLITVSTKNNVDISVYFGEIESNASAITTCKACGHNTFSKSLTNKLEQEN